MVFFDGFLKYFKLNSNECVTLRQLLEITCNRMRYDPRDYFFMFNGANSAYSIIDMNTIINDKVSRL
jgi:hypothetical protein